MVVRMGDALIMALHDIVLDAIFIRFEEALRRSGASVNAIKAQAILERAQIVRKRYGHALLKRRPKRCKY